MSSLRKILSDDKISRSVEKTAQQLITSVVSLNRYIISSSICPNFLHDVSKNNTIISDTNNQANSTIEAELSLPLEEPNKIPIPVPIPNRSENNEQRNDNSNHRPKNTIPIPANKPLMSYHSEPLSSIVSDQRISSESSILADSRNAVKPNRSLQLQLPSFSSASFQCKEYVVCRICDEKIPADMIDRHTVLCVKNYDNVSFITDVNKQLQTIRDSISNNYLNVEWPGPSEKALSQILKVLNLLFIVDNVIAIEMNYSINEIQMIRSLICKKLCAAKAAKINMERLKNTGATGNTLSMKQAFISDFEFIKRISSGAYAKVFLGRKKKTGDIYAIKVIPKKSLTEKNQVKRLYAEKDILLQFSNPHIVSFCMYFFLDFK